MKSEDEVPELALDYDEIFRRGGENCGDEDFALLKCPRCPRIYLLEYEVDTLYTNPDDLTERVPVSDYPRSFNCISCGARFFGETGRWLSPEEMKVSWHQLSHSPWRWVTQSTRMDQNSPEC